MYIGTPRDPAYAVKSLAVSPNDANEKPPLFEVNDGWLWELLGTLVDEWETADDAGKEKLEIRFTTQFPEMVKRTGN